MAQEQLKAAIAALALTIDAEFVPFSKSRHAKPTPKMQDRSLNWRVTLKREGREILTTDYSAGIAHCPSYNQSDAMKPTLHFAEAIAQETETGRRRYASGIGGPRTPIMPDAADVIYSLVSDASVLDHSKFEDWASDYGYDADSRSAEAIYRQCLEIALQLRNGIGEEGLAQLQEASQDY